MYFFSVLQDPRRPYHHRYDFIFDRFRALRQEMVIQNFDERQSICLLEPIIVFLAYSSYRLCNESIQNYDPKICHQHLQECLKKILCCYDATGGCQNNRAQVEAIYLLFNLGKADALLRGVSSKKAIDDEQFGNSIEIALNYWQLNFQRCFRKSKKLPPLLLAVFSLKFQEMRR
jgi:SAC3 domain-containing protein 1